MAKYIEQEALAADGWYLQRHINGNGYARIEIMNILDIPAADVVEVKHGKWMPHIITSGRSYYFCSICKKMVDIPASFMIHRFHYCPYCGAKMVVE